MYFIHPLCGPSYDDPCPSRRRGVVATVLWRRRMRRAGEEKALRTSPHSGRSTRRAIRPRVSLSCAVCELLQAERAGNPKHDALAATLYNAAARDAARPRTTTMRTSAFRAPSPSSYPLGFSRTAEPGNCVRESEGRYGNKRNMPSSRPAREGAQIISDRLRGRCSAQRCFADPGSLSIRAPFAAVVAGASAENDPGSAQRHFMPQRARDDDGRERSAGEWLNSYRT